MTSSIRVFHTGGNKALKVIVEVLVADYTPPEEPTTKWVEQQTYDLSHPGWISENIYIHDGQRVRVEETGDFIS